MVGAPGMPSSILLYRFHGNNSTHGRSGLLVAGSALPPASSPLAREHALQAMCSTRPFNEVTVQLVGQRVVGGVWDAQVPFLSQALVGPDCKTPMKGGSRG